MEQDADWLARRLPGKRLVDRFVPEFHAHDANGGIGHHLGQPDELEVECAEGGVCVLDGRRHEAADEVSIVVACPADGKRLEKKKIFFKEQCQCQSVIKHTEAASSSTAEPIRRRPRSRSCDGSAEH